MVLLADRNCLCRKNVNMGDRCKTKYPLKLLYPKPHHCPVQNFSRDDGPSAAITTHKKSRGEKPNLYAL